MTIRYPAVALILLVGPSGSGKSTFARKHFGETEIISSDRCRALIGDDEARQDINDDAFSLLHHWLVEQAVDAHADIVFLNKCR